MAWGNINTLPGVAFLGKSYSVATTGDPAKPAYASMAILDALVAAEPKVQSVSFYNDSGWVALVQVADDGADEGAVDTVMAGYAT